MREGSGIDTITTMQSTVPDINLLPPEYRSTTIRVGRISILLIMLALLSLLPLLLVRSYNQNAVANLEQRVEEQRSEASRVENMLAQREATLEEITTVLRRADVLERQSAEFERAGPQISTSFRAINEALPPRVTLLAIEEQEAQLLIRGRAGSSSLVVEFAQALKTRSDGRQVVIDEMQQVSPEMADAQELPPSTVLFRLSMEN